MPTHLGDSIECAALPEETPGQHIFTVRDEAAGADMGKENDCPEHGARSSSSDMPQLHFSSPRGEPHASFAL